MENLQTTLCTYKKQHEDVVGVENKVHCVVTEPRSSLRSYFQFPEGFQDGVFVESLRENKTIQDKYLKQLSLFFGRYEEHKDKEFLHFRLFQQTCFESL